MKEIKDSGDRQEYSSGMVREGEGDRPMFSLLFPKDVPYADTFLTACANHLAKGAKKYSVRNWESANTEEEEERFCSSLLRHTIQAVLGEDDEDHYAAAFFNLLALHTIRYKMRNGEESAEGPDHYPEVAE